MTQVTNRKRWYLEVKGFDGKFRPRIEYDNLPTEKTVDGKRKIRSLTQLNGNDPADLDKLKSLYGHANQAQASTG